ncbi:unnamed protein product [Symbiodinium sp. CCMP2592]|nr:unnamed protein product [Symbiodinium sp. CCMP2592]
MFVGSWIASWVSLAFNSYQMVFGHGSLKLDVLYVAPVMVLLLGLFMTNLQGYLEEHEADPALAKAAAWDMDMALGRGVPLSMVSFYLASRHLVEAPTCQLAASVGRALIQGRGPEAVSLLVPAVAGHRQICSFELPFGGLGFNCTPSEDLNQPLLLSQLQQPGVSKTALDEHLNKIRHMETTIWDAAHCEESVWMLQPLQGANRCGQEFSDRCLDPKVDPSPGPLQEFNFFMRSQLVPILKANRKAEKAARRIAAESPDSWIRFGSTLASWSFMVDRIVQFLHSDRKAVGPEELAGVLITSWRQWHTQFVVGLVSLLMSIQPITTMVGTSRHLKPFQKRRLSIHMVLDILIVECAAISILNAKVIVHFGSGWWQALQTVLSTLSDHVLSSPNPSSPHLSNIWVDATAAGPGLIEQCVDGMKVGPGVCARLMVSVLVIYISSTCLLGTSSVTKRFPLVSRWNAAVGGPFQVLGAVSEDEVHELCGRVRWQILVRTLLLSFLLAVFLLPATSFSVGMITSLVLKVTVFRAPFVIGWMVLAALHVGTGMLVVEDIAENQSSRNLRRRLRGMEAAEASARSHPPYGTFVPQAQVGCPGASVEAPMPEGAGMHGPQAPSPSLPPGIRMGPEPQAGWQAASAETPFRAGVGMQSPQAPSPSLPPSSRFGPDGV